jgi:SAM-dependent methyltransferase
MSFAQSITNEDSDAVKQLRVRLDEFYRTTQDYSDFSKELSRHDHIWAQIVARIRELAATGRKVRVLEFGAGRTGFMTALGDLRNSVDFTAQDVTPANLDYLRGASDRQHIGPLQQLTEPYDIIFSTFVWEHVSDPKATMKHLLSILSPGGSIFIACQHYDYPGYVPPSARHYGTLTQYAVSWWLWRQRAKMRNDRDPACFIHTDPSMFHMKWFRDSDAIHWVSTQDFAKLAPGCDVTHLTIPGSGLRNWVWRTFLLAFVRITKPAQGARS